MPDFSHILHSWLPLLSISTMITTGAPRRAVTDDTESSVGERTSRAKRSDKRQKEAPPRKQAGTMTDGIVVLKSLRIRWGTATPTKDMRK